MTNLEQLSTAKWGHITNDSNEFWALVRAIRAKLPRTRRVREVLAVLTDEEMEDGVLGWYPCVIDDDELDTV